ncbi:hypothetical protein NIES2135_60470 (plasmid) [Leptolyngbya boryana NIES-2135]|jgi:hypothetical protein|uniref:Uncharacterized protein n=1 Tax=Leptolyngbya boryana NIES-2135 TaxID=1973484 RepID=A0A1Z4JR37_LEPBY|nr:MULTISPECIES: hypothetical protein [Leptolyngbya]BAY59170.1 hypothetical protein NIES2135_60470 [Leptolyngbya boryana NIES-2135]MBD2372756.1 hypothetical protein [Leptolyngbya sp. FACHB-238]MBD2397492.1 hypothetical protein [Leptolyngbya sp. FACHB-239]MBD2403703.1 hypothetical protein [Leptolyngbya sp. FACHB-402]ULP33363.1 hypothetical protein MCP04_29980 [Leptolyngbya boryana IU 594]
MIRLDIPLFEHLQDAIAFPQEAQLLELLQEFDAAMLGLEERHQLEVAADAILQLATIVEAKYVGVMEQVNTELKKSRDPVVPIDFFDRFVRQSMLVNFEQFIEPIPLLPLPSPSAAYWSVPDHFFMKSLSESEMVKAIHEAMIDDAAALLDALPDRNVEQPDFNAIVHLSHGEEIQGWTDALIAMMEKLQHRHRGTVSLLDLIFMLKTSRIESKRKECFIDLWLAFLLGNHAYRLRRTAHDFYSPVGIRVEVED